MIELLNCDCMEYMKTVPDKFFDLAIVDPPYGIDRGKNFGLKEFGWKQHRRSAWDSKIPEINYFNELFRVSANQIIWGGNYMVEFLDSSMGWIVWDKGQRDFSTSDAELAFSSFDTKLRVFNMSRGAALQDNGGTTIHPTQKPVKLYKWLLKNYAKEGDKIFDSHLGSGSIAIACHDMKFDLVGCEIDKDYYDAAVKRFTNHKKQIQLW